MSVSTSASGKLRLTERPPSGIFRYRLGFTCGLILLVSTLAQAIFRVTPDRLVVDQAYDAPLYKGQATFDLYLEADSPVRLLVSNLGAANHTATLRARADQSPTLAWQHHLVPWNPSAATHKPAPLKRANRPRQTIDAKLQNEREGGKLHRDFWLHVTDTPLENPQGYQRVQGRLLRANQQVEVYADSALVSSGTELPLIGKQADAIAECLSRDVLPLITRHIGTITDADQNGRLTVLLTPWLGRLRGGTTQVRGFVRSSDLRMDIAAPFSNHADLLYLNSELPAGDALRSLLLHEVAHTALASRPAYSSQHGRTPEWEDWLNEGLAHLMERAGSRDWSNLDYRVASYWQNSATSPLTVRDYYRTGRWRNHGCRGATYLFLDWCQAQARKAGVSQFTRELMATGKTGSDAIEQVCQRPFADLYRAWTISLLDEPDGQRPTRKVGRFLSSGPRFHNWNLTRSPEQEFQVSGTATKFVELRASQSGMYRVVLTGDALDDWQLTLIREAKTIPEIALQARWGRAEASTSAKLVVRSQESLPAGWCLEEISCEMIREPQVRVWNWTAANLGVTDSSQFEATLPLAETGLADVPMLLKARFKNGTGDDTWSWIDVPATRLTEPLTVTERGTPIRQIR